MSDRRFHKQTGTDPLMRVKRHLMGVFGAVGFFSLFANLLLLAAPLYMLQVYDRVLSSRSDETLLYLTLIALAAFVAYAALDFVRGRLMVVAAGWLDRQLRGPVLACSLAERLNGGRDSVDALRDVTTLRATLSSSAVQPLLDAPWTPIFLAAMFLLHPVLGWTAVAGALALLAIALVNELATRKLVATAGGLSGEMDHAAEEAVRNADAVEAMGLAANFERRLNAKNGVMLGILDQASVRGGLASSVSRLLRYGLQIGVLGLGAWLVLQNELSPGAIIAASILMARALAPVDMAISSWRNIVAGRRAYDRIKSLLGRAPGANSRTRLPRPLGVVNAERITCAPSEGVEPALAAVSFALDAGDSLGIVGPTAAGKTTLARVLVGSLKPRSGAARLDGADMAAWSADDRGRYVGYMPQTVELFSGTVRDNIARLTDGDDRAVVEAAQAAGAHRMILALSKGYETEIGAGGVQLSGGQRQLIGLARALYGDPAFVVLDEPNANLDRYGEDALMGVLKSLKARGVTAVIISHRPNVMQGVDKMLVLDAGRVAMFGLRDDVIAAVSEPRQPKALAQ